MENIILILAMLTLFVITIVLAGIIYICYQVNRINKCEYSDVYERIDNY